VNLEWKEVNEPTSGLLSLFGLTEWWNTAFTETEKEYIESVYKPFGSDPSEKLLTGSQLAAGKKTTETPISLLYGLAQWFNSKKDIDIAKRIIAKADELSTPDLPVLDLHFHYSTMIQLYYKGRDEPASLARSVWACQRQIELSPQAASEFKREHRELKASAIRDSYDSNLPARCKLPRHIGFQQMCILLEKDGDFKGALRLAKRAFREGWDGDWDRRIPKLEKRVDAAKKTLKRRQT
jgi:hypothetical protein